MSLNLKPLGDRLIVEPTESEEVTASGIVLPETAKEKPQQGKVLAAGPGRRGRVREGVGEQERGVTSQGYGHYRGNLGGGN